MAIRTGVERGEVVDLRIQYYNGQRVISDTDTMPQVEISKIDGTIVRPMSSQNVTRISEGLYQIQFFVPTDFPTGPSNDRWLAAVGGIPEENQFQFLVLQSQADGYGDTLQELGDEVRRDWSQEEIEGINCLLNSLNQRLNNKGFINLPNGSGGFEKQPCNIFSTDELVAFLSNGLDYFNSVPHFTNFLFSDPCINNCMAGSSVSGFSNLIVEYAYLLALIALSPLEKGRMFNITDNGVTFTPPDIADLLMSIHSARFTRLLDDIKYIKVQFKPGVRSLGSFSGIMNARLPSYSRLRHLRGRRIY